MTKTGKYLLVIPSYNSADLIARVFEKMHDIELDICVVIDGSDDQSVESIEKFVLTKPNATLLYHELNLGKGAAIYTALLYAKNKAYTHIFCMDADDQHPAELIPKFIATSRTNPSKAILGKPEFGADAPKARVRGRKLSNFLVRLFTLNADIGDALYGFRVYPLAPTLQIMHAIKSARGFDFEPVIATRLAWAGVDFINISSPTRYFAKDSGGVSHFNYLRDNILLARTYFFLLLETLLRLPVLFWRKIFGTNSSGTNSKS